MLLQGVLKITFRNLKKNITSTLIKILGLAVSISAVIIIWSFVINENKFDRGIPNSNRIYRLEAHWASMPPFLGHAINQNLTNQVIATRLNFWGDVGIQVNNIPYNLKDLTFTDSTFFKTFPLEFIAGNPEEALIQPFSLVLSESLARRLFGRIDAIGKIVRFENQFDFTVTAIIKDQPFLHFKTDVLASMISLEQIRYKGVLKEYDGWSYPTYLLLPEGIRVAESEKTIFDLLKKTGYNDQFRLRPFSKIYYSPEVENESNTKHGNILYNKILIAVSIFILLLAAINFINLTIANAVARSKEVSIKKLQGASLFQLIVQFVFETVLIIFISFGLSFFLLWFFAPLLNSITGFPVSSAGLFTPDNLLLFAAGLIVFVLITGIYPSLYISAYTINTNKERLSGYSKHNWIRNGLIVFQNLVSITLICSTLIVNQQFRYMNKKDLGFNKNDIVNLKINSQLKGHLDLFKEKLSAYPEILSVSYSSRVPGNYWGSWCCVNIEGKENKFFNNYVDPDYLKTMGIRIKEGRNFSVNNPGDKKATYLINETAVKLYDLKNPIGQVIVPGNGVKGQIIGIINDFHYRGLNYEKTPLLLFYTPDYVNYVNVKVSNNSITRALVIIKGTWEEVCPAFAFEYNFLDETFDLQYKSEKRFENLLFSFALLALFIASIGLFGLSIYSTKRRTKEIGIRKINGARVSEIMAMLNKDVIKWVTIAYVIACPVAWYAMKKWLLNFAYKTELSWWIFALAGLLALGIALLTVSWQSWRAATRNPVEALRYE
ncbi:MAG: ABC transporter permease [Bacteroidia bacterium]|nr:ABC transporter permease [Bacteroidia bacterium]